nr:MAG TPA: hypothetical protein [Crassvirales sp.]DAQ45639.1 MAG TPA: hypothetical protein [Caudoviricetes sp.]
MILTRFQQLRNRIRIRLLPCYLMYLELKIMVTILPLTC